MGAIRKLPPPHTRHIRAKTHPLNRCFKVLFCERKHICNQPNFRNWSFETRVDIKTKRLSRGTFKITLFPLMNRNLLRCLWEQKIRGIFASHSTKADKRRMRENDRNVIHKTCKIKKVAPMYTTENCFSIYLLVWDKFIEIRWLRSRRITWQTHHRILWTFRPFFFFDSFSFPSHLTLPLLSQPFILFSLNYLYFSR